MTCKFDLFILRRLLTVQKFRFLRVVKRPFSKQILQEWHKDEVELFKFLDTFTAKVIVLVASGASARNLVSINGDVCVFVCNNAIKKCIDIGLNNVNLYLNHSLDATMMRYFNDWASVNIDLVLTGSKKEFKKLYNKAKVLSFPPVILWKDLVVSKVLEKNTYSRSCISNDWPSSGVLLLLLAIIAKPKKIITIGLDVSEAGYFDGKNNYNFHMKIDAQILNHIKDKNMVSVEKVSTTVKTDEYSIFFSS